MDSSSGRYLHKKFKKQNVDFKNQNAPSEKSTPSIQNKENEKNCTTFEDLQMQQQTIQCGKVAVYDRSYRNDSVPTQSTNETNLNLSVLPSSNASNFVTSSISSVDNLVEKYYKNVDSRTWNSETNRSRELGKSQLSNICISYVNSNSARNLSLDKDFTFDTTVNTYESAQDTATSSSILEHFYPKSFNVTPPIKIENSEDNSTSVSGEKNQFAEDNNTLEIKLEKAELQEPSVPDKTSGGKYVCTYCNLVCSKPSVLQKHIRAHTNERPFPCTSCGFSFKTRSNLYKHCRSRTHANRVMGNKTQEISNELDVDSQSKSEYTNHVSSQSNNFSDTISKPISKDESDRNIIGTNVSKDIGRDIKQKPYKPRFKAAFFDNGIKENGESNARHVENSQARQTNTDLLSLHINELIHKNNSIVNSNDPYLLKKRNVDNNYVDTVNNNEYVHRYNDNPYSPNNNSSFEHSNHDEPLNLTSNSRKRCLSEITEPTVQKSLIKELLLKNLYADTNKQCPYCKMIFQTVTELDLHKLRSCKGFTKSGARYSRSSSVNVASILTQNKNAFDTNPHIPNTVFPLKSPGPFLGKTRLVDSDKSKSFSFEDGIQTNFQSSFQSPNDLMKTSQRYSLSPLSLQNEKNKKNSVKLFGGEVKITHTSGETKSYRVDGKDEKYNTDVTYEYGGKLSENRVVKSSLQSGGTVLQNKPTYNKKDMLRSSPDVMRAYENSSVSPSIDIVNLEKKFNFDRQVSEIALDHNNGQMLLQNPVEMMIPSAESVYTSTYKYTNIMDFSQKAAKLFAPNLKQLNLSIPNIPVPNKFVLPHNIPLSIETKPEDLGLSKIQIDSDRINISPRKNCVKDLDIKEEKNFENSLAQKHFSFEKKNVPESPNLSSPNIYNPMNLLVNGKVIRYVPGIPGPIAADAPLDAVYSNNIVATLPRSVSLSTRIQKPNIKITPVDVTPSKSPLIKSFVPESASYQNNTDRSNDLKQSSSVYLDIEKTKSPKLNNLEVKSDSISRTNELRSPKSNELKTARTNDLKSPVIKSPNHLLSSSTETPRKFARPNSLALKPTVTDLKKHHGLTPTMFNQILISPDTPRVAKKYNHQILHGNYFSYLGLKSSTKSVYCTLNKTQPFYVPHFKKLSMYSEWRQQDHKSDKLYVSAYDSRQKQQKYTTSWKAQSDLIVHSSYKYTKIDVPPTKEEASRSILGGYESNEDYTYVRGRGRGRYVCDQCGIRCKKPSMLKKHIRTHSNDRPFTCNHCNFSFKTKGNLTKHMKSKAHTKNSATNNSSNSDEDSGMDSSDESTRQQEHEAAYGLLSLSQKPSNMISQNDSIASPNSVTQSSSSSINIVSSENPTRFMDTEQIAHVTKTNYAKNKILDHQSNVNFNTSKFSELIIDRDSEDSENVTFFLGKTNTNRPLTYPYTSILTVDTQPNITESLETKNNKFNEPLVNITSEKNEPKNIKQFNVIKKYSVFQRESHSPKYTNVNNVVFNKENENVQNCSNMSTYENDKIEEPVTTTKFQSASPIKICESIVRPVSPQNIASDLRKRKGSPDDSFSPKLQKNDSDVIDLSMPTNIERKNQTVDKFNGAVRTCEIKNSNVKHLYSEVTIYNPIQTIIKKARKEFINHNIKQIDEKEKNQKIFYDTTDEDSYTHNEDLQSNYNDESVFKKNDVDVQNEVNNHMSKTYNPVFVAQTTIVSESAKSFKQVDYDNSAMETLADIATKQVKLEKNSIAKNVATEFLKLATKNEYQNNDGLRDSTYMPSNKDMNELIVKPEENKNCTICSKSFIKPSQLRLHMNIHYLERPYRCDSCSVSFRTKGHLQKHERSAGHHNKLSSSPTLSSSEPRPFKCSDCIIAFRIHGHLAKHLRSKMHIMKLECLAKIPFGLYAELERSNSLLTEINTTDGDQCLESLKALAKKVFLNDPNKLNQLGPSSTESIDADS